MFLYGRVSEKGEKMARYIDADQLRSVMYHEAFEKDSDWQKWDGGCWIRYKMFETCVEAIPSADVRENQYAKDIYLQAKGHCEFKCSLCGVEIGVVEGGLLDGGEFKFCPNCGCSMRGDKDERT